MDLSIKELKATANIRGIKGYKSLSEDELLSALTSSKPAKKGKKKQKQIFLMQEKKRSEKNLMNQDISFLN